MSRSALRRNGALVLSCLLGLVGALHCGDEAATGAGSGGALGGGGGVLGGQGAGDGDGDTASGDGDGDGDGDARSGDGDGDGDQDAGGDGDGDGDGGSGLASAHCGDPASYGAPLAAASVSAAPVAVPQGGFGFLEGPVWIAGAGALLFSDMDAGSIRRLTVPSTLDVFAPGANSNGLAVDGMGDVVACTHGSQAVSAFTYPGAVHGELAGSPPAGGETFNSPNDVTVRSDGTLYFTDPSYQRDGWPGTGALTGVYRRTPGGGVSLVDGDRNQPNGITLSPDERTLYVADADANVYRYDVAADGSVGSPEYFVTVGGPDGMTVDCAGNLYVANHGAGNVRVYAPDGQDLGTIDAAPSTTNVAFGGADRRTLYITAAGALLSIELAVPGMPY